MQKNVDKNLPRDTELRNKYILGNLNRYLKKIFVSKMYETNDIFLKEFLITLPVDLLIVSTLINV